MNFYGMRELSNNTKNVMTSVNQNGSAVITDNGKPAALMISISEENFEATLDAIRQMRARQAVDALRKQAQYPCLRTDVSEREAGAPARSGDERGRYALRR